MMVKRIRNIRILAIILAMVLAITCMGAPLLVDASDDISGDGYSYNSITGTLTVNTNEGTNTWRDDENILPENVNNIIIEDTVSIIETFAFADCSSIGEINLPDSITSIMDRAFFGSGLSAIRLSNNLKTIGEEAFAYCNLSSIIIPDSVVTMESHAFFATTSLTTVVIGSGVETISMYTFYESPIETLTFKNGLKTIGNNAFYMSQLSSVIIPNSVTTIEGSAFMLSSKLANIVMSSRINTIGQEAFSYIANNAVVTMTGENPPTIATDSFPLTTTFNVPKDASGYQSTGNWGSISVHVNITEELPNYSGIPAAVATKASTMHNQISLNTVSVSGETVAYAKSDTKIAPTDDASWQTSPVFTGLNDNTAYYFFTRVQANATHKADDPSIATSIKTDEIIEAPNTDVSDAKGLAEVAIENMVVTNETTDNDILVVVQNSINGINTVTASWKQTPTMIKATATSVGSIIGTIILSDGNVMLEVVINKQINVLLPMYSYAIISGQNGTWVKNSVLDLVITIDGDYNKFSGIKVDYMDVQNTYYTAAKGSTIITLKAEYLNTLDVGVHTVTVLFNGREVQVQFHVLDEMNSQLPNHQDGTSTTQKTIINTSDNTQFGIYIVAIILASIGGIVLIVKKKQK